MHGASTGMIHTPLPWKTEKKTTHDNKYHYDVQYSYEHSAVTSAYAP